MAVVVSRKGVIGKLSLSGTLVSLGPAAVSSAIFLGQTTAHSSVLVCRPRSFHHLRPSFTKEFPNINNRTESFSILHASSTISKLPLSTCRSAVARSFSSTSSKPGVLRDLLKHLEHFLPRWLKRKRRKMGGLKDPLIWIDLEMTGLDPDKDQIIELYVLITDGSLVPADAEGWGTEVSCPQTLLDGMDEWCTSTHASTGLTARVQASTVTPSQAADQLLAYIQKYVPEPRTALLAGNSVHTDRMFLRQEPWRKVYDYVHYRIFDMSVLGEAAKRWSSDGTMRMEPRKKRTHTAKDDILESLEQAKFYRDVMFGWSERSGEEDEEEAEAGTETEETEETDKTDKTDKTSDASQGT